MARHGPAGAVYCTQCEARGPARWSRVTFSFAKDAEEMIFIDPS